MGKMYPHPQCHSAKLRKLGYVPPVWHRAIRRAPPKDLYPLKRVSKSMELPGDKVVKQVFKRMPMLRKERYEFYNAEYKPLATRIALTTMRLQKEHGLDQDAAFKKCENEIFKEELYYFAKNIRDNPGNHFKLTNSEIRNFYVHDLINEAQFLKKRIATAVEQAAANDQGEQNSHVPTPVKNVRIAQDTLAEYFAEDEPIFEDILAERGFEKVTVSPFYHPYKLSGVHAHPKQTYITHSDYSVDDVLLYRHGGFEQENQRYIRSQVQVPASAFLDSIEFADDTIDAKQGIFDAFGVGDESGEIPDDNFMHKNMLAMGTHHISKDEATYFTATEGLTFRQLSKEELSIDQEIAQLLLKQDKLAAANANKQ